LPSIAARYSQTLRDFLHSLPFSAFALCACARRTKRAGSDVDLDKTARDHNSVTGLFKLYLRELPEPLLTHAFYEPFLQISADGMRECTSHSGKVIRTIE
jgi:hypothetical protein